MRVAKAAQAVLRWTLAFGGIPSDAEKELHAALAEAGYLVPDLPEQQPPEPAARKPKQRPCVPSPEPAAQDRLYWTAKDLAYRWGPRHHEDQDHCADENKARQIAHEEGLDRLKAEAERDRLLAEVEQLKLNLAVAQRRLRDDRLDP